jgi:hypothetical protein
MYTQYENKYTVKSVSGKVNLTLRKLAYLSATREVNILW